MHKLQRGNAPDGLDRYRHGKNRWEDVSSEDKSAIWTALEQMQGRRCAYCESGIDEGRRHIEHFRQRARHQRGTFDWSNLFGSCNRDDRCGKHKDRCTPEYALDDLIKPDIDDPEHFFLFVSDGSIALRTGLSAVEQRRAQETLRVFNLQHRPLRYQRQQAVAGYVQTSEALCAIAAEYPEQQWLPLLESELAAIADLPFATAIKHTLMMP